MVLFKYIFHKGRNYQSIYIERNVILAKGTIFTPLCLHKIRNSTSKTPSISHTVLTAQVCYEHHSIPVIPKVLK